MRTRAEKWLAGMKSALRADTRRSANRSSTASVTKDPISSGPSPNPATNLVIADLAMRAGGEVMRMGVERALLGRRYGSRGAKKAAAGRTLKQTLVGAALGRIATTSVPGALIVGGGMLAKTLYDRAHDTREAKAKGDADIADQASEAD